MKDRAEFTIKFGIDLDPVPGTGHTPECWVRYLTQLLGQNAHYNPKFEITVDGVVSTRIETNKLREMIRTHDVSYNFSDDGGVFRRGSLERQRIHDQMRAAHKAGTTAQEICDLWNEIVGPRFTSPNPFLFDVKYVEKILKV